MLPDATCEAIFCSVGALSAGLPAVVYAVFRLGWEGPVGLRLSVILESLIGVVDSKMKYGPEK